jgi:hypothetical protein
MRVVTSYDAVYRLRNHEYDQIVASIAAGKGYRINPARYVGEIAANLSSLSQADAKLLHADNIKSQRRNRYLSPLSSSKPSEPKNV